MTTTRYEHILADGYKEPPPRPQGFMDVLREQIAQEIDAQVFAELDRIVGPQEEETPRPQEEETPRRTRYDFLLEA